MKSSLLVASLLVAACGGGAKSTTRPSGPAPAPREVTVSTADNQFRVRVGDEVLVDVPARFDDFESVESDAFEVDGSGGRVWLAQWMGQQGEDELSREIEAWLVDASRGVILWTGKASFSNSFGECEVWTNIPEPSFADGTVTITLASGVEILEEGTDRCEGAPIARTEGAKIVLD